MSFTIDANILIFGANDAAPQHRAARRALSRAWRGSEQVVLCWPAVVAYVRVVTRRELLPNPASITEAIESIEQLLRLPHVWLVSDTAEGWRILREVALGNAVRGGLIHDAHLVALMRQHGVETIWTHDRDFRRFDGIRVYDPVREG